MIIPFEYGMRKDGVKLFRRLDVKVDKSGEPLMTERKVTDENGNTEIVKEPIPTGFKIHKIGTEEYYDEAIDVEDVPFTYEETDILIETPKE